MLTAADYRAAFEQERQREYPVVDAFEAQCGFAVDRKRLEDAAEFLACPVKKSPPNWQHGRVLYAAARRYLEDNYADFSLHSPRSEPVDILDIGTAKGFSALCLHWALDDSDSNGRVTSIDVIDPHARVSRNTVAEVDGLLTLADTLKPWPEAKAIDFERAVGVEWLKASERIHIAFVDGSHNGTTVMEEGRLLAEHQDPGDLAIFDDVDRPDIASAVASLACAYRFEVLEVLPRRAYAIGVRR